MPKMQEQFLVGMTKEEGQNVTIFGKVLTYDIHVGKASASCLRPLPTSM